MKRYLRTIAIFLTISVNLFALHRDYKSDFDERHDFQNYYYPYCLEHVPGGYPDWIDSSLINLMPSTDPKCRQCNHHSVYLGYIDPDFRKYRSHLEHQLKYCRENKKCHCYWPEYSKEAALISDSAYLLFRDLIKTTALSSLLEDEIKINGYDVKAIFNKNIETHEVFLNDAWVVTQ